MKRKKTLVIHPFDFSTRFLCSIYGGIEDATVITGNATKDYIKSIISNFDTVIMCGHGSPFGLFSVGQFGPNTRGYIIDETMVEQLRGKKLIFVWCHANKFVERNKLQGFSSSMFCSEYSECEYERVKGVKKGMVEESNDAFAKILSKYINKPLNVIHEKVTREYGVLGEVNPVAKYNNSRLLLF